MFSLTRKIKNSPAPPATAAGDIARLAIAEDGTIVFANDSFRALSHTPESGFPGALELLQFSHTIQNVKSITSGVHRVHVKGKMESIDFHFNWLTTPDNKRYLVGSEAKEGKTGDSPTAQTPQDDFAALANLSGDMMLVIGNAGEIRNINAAFTAITGYGEGDIQALAFLDLFHPEDQPYIRGMNAEDATDNATTDFQARIVTKTGTHRWVEWRQQSNAGKTWCVGRDITAIREQQLAMGRRERQLSQAEAIGRMGHWNWTLGETEIEWSAEIYRIFGVKPENFTPSLETMKAAIHKSDRPRVDHVFQRASLGQNNYEVEFRITRPGGEIRFLRCEGRCARDNNGEVTALYGIMQDMTERMLYERELKESKEAVEHAYAAKTQFLANMSHELRTPLNAIIGFSEMIHRQLLGPIGTEKYLEYIQGIRESGEHLLDLISDILDMSKIEAGKYELGFEDVNVAKTIRLAAHMMESRASDAQVTLNLDTLTNENLHIVADRRALLQVILNIFSNAVKFTNAGGRVDVECTEGKEFITIKIADNGIGIPAHKLAGITRPFEQVSSHYTREHEGTGLGLAITKELVELHGGALQIDSTVDIGTIVTIRLPYDASLKK